MINKIIKSSIRLTRREKLINKFIKREAQSKTSSGSGAKYFALKNELEKAFNEQINLEFFASFTYLAMAAHFGRQDVALPGCHRYFLEQVQDEREHGQKLIDYLNKRGSVAAFQEIQAPRQQKWDSPLTAFKDALELEKCVSQNIFDLHKLAEEMNDACACILLENEFMENQVEEFDRISRHVTELEMIGNDGLGIFYFDKSLLEDEDKKKCP